MAKPTGKPLVSVLLPAYNAETTVGAAIQDVLQQTYEHLELVIVDDGSTDRTAEVIRTFRDDRIRLLTFPINAGLGVVWQVALSAARGELVAVMASDDRTDARRLELQVPHFLGNANLGALGTAATVSVPAENRTFIVRNPLSDEELQRRLLLQNQFVAGSVMMRRSIVQEVGGFRDFAQAEDYDLWLRISEVSSVGNIDEVLYTYFDRTTNTSRQNFAFQEDMAREAVRAAMRRRSGRADKLGARQDLDLARSRFGRIGLKRRQVLWTRSALGAYGLRRSDRTRGAIGIAARTILTR